MKPAAAESPTSLHRPADPALRGLVESVWAHEPTVTLLRPGAREHVLPTGATHIALRLDGPPIRVFDGLADRRGHALGHAVVGGARSVYHLRDVSRPAPSVGAMLCPGAARVLLGVPESALAGHHSPLSALLHPAEVDQLHTRLRACDDAATRLATFERWLIGRARGRPPALHPALAGALREAGLPGRRVGDIVRASGFSQRHCIALFRESFGLTPGEWLRLRRFADVLRQAAEPSRGWADIAAASGFADQAHLANSFRAVAGLTPSAWRLRADPATPRHVPR